MASEKDKQWTSIRVSRETKAELHSIKHPGQSDDGMLQELVRFWKRVHPEEYEPPGIKEIVSEP